MLNLQITNYKFQITMLKTTFKPTTYNLQPTTYNLQPKKPKKYLNKPHHQVVYLMAFPAFAKKEVTAFFPFFKKIGIR